METYATTVYVITEEVLRILGAQDDPQSKMSNAEVVTFSLIAAKYFSGNHKIAQYICKRLRFFKNILSHSRLNRRIHKIPLFCWHAIFRFLSLLFNPMLRPIFRQRLFSRLQIQVERRSQGGSPWQGVKRRRCGLEKSRCRITLWGATSSWRNQL
jgi:hypothetical protein